MELMRCGVRFGDESRSYFLIDIPCRKDLSVVSRRRGYRAERIEHLQKCQGTGLEMPLCLYVKL